MLVLVVSRDARGAACSALSPVPAAQGYCYLIHTNTVTGHQGYCYYSSS